MLYVPATNMDLIYINPYGYDMRQLDPQLPDICKSFDEKDFMRNPSHPNSPKFQFDMFKLKLENYIDALTHVLSTGESFAYSLSCYCPYSPIFAKALVEVVGGYFLG